MVDRENERAPTWLVVVASLFLMIPVTWFIIYLFLRKFKVKGNELYQNHSYTSLSRVFFLTTSSPLLFLFGPVTIIFRGMFYFLWGEIIPQSKSHQLLNFRMYENFPRRN